MRIQQALTDVAHLRAQLNRTTSVRCFRSQATGFSSLLVVAAAVVQATLLESIAAQPNVWSTVWLTIWLTVAVVSSLVAGMEMLFRGWRSSSPQVWQTHRRLIRRILPALLVGGVLTFVVARQVNQNSSPTGNLIWALPGLWSLLYGAGLFSCRSELPRRASLVAAYFQIVGTGLLLLVPANDIPAGWQMVVLFGVGQFLLAVVLMRNIESTQESIEGRHE